MKFFSGKIDKSLNENGIQITARKLLIYSSTRLVVDGLTPQLKEILQNEAVVIVANHPFEAEPIVLFSSLPPRKNVKLIINSDFMNISKKLNSYLIPVYVSHHKREKKRDLIGWVFNAIFPTKVYSKDEAQAKNKENIEIASELLKKGEMILIFPGKRGVNGRWFSGVGHMLKGTGGSNVYIVNCFINGTSYFDRLRFVKLIGRILPKITLTFSDAQAFKYKNYDGKTIAEKLEKEYLAWVESLRR